MDFVRRTIKRIAGKKPAESWVVLGSQDQRKELATALHKHQRQEQIANIAYRIWERQGRPDGKDQEHWRLAESMYDHPMKVTIPSW